MPIHLPPIHRRQFLSGSLAAAASVAAGPLWADEPKDANRYILLADTHVWAKREGEHRQTKPSVNYGVAVRQILALRPRPAGVVFVGDTVFMEGQPDDYTVLADGIKQLREAGLSVSLSLGNHDHRENFWKAFPEDKAKQLPVENKQVAVVETPRANIFLLDSLDKTNVTPGVLGEKQLGWLAKALDARADKPAIVVAHHDPQRNLPKISGLLDTPAFYDVILPRKFVKAYIFGHTHRWSLSQHEGLHLVNLPPTAWVFDGIQPQGWVDLTLGEKQIGVTLNTLDGKHAKHGEQGNLSFRA